MSELQKAGKRIEVLTEYLHKCQIERDEHEYYASAALSALSDTERLNERLKAALDEATAIIRAGKSVNGSGRWIKRANEFLKKVSGD
jgi:predicted  nucleic acid-binding Zn-ribbon protein